MKSSITVCSTILMTVAASLSSADAGQLMTLHSFAGGPAGGIPEQPLTFDAAGNLYGTTVGNLANGGDTASTVFMLKRSITPGGVWTEQTLLSFANGAVISGRAAIGANGQILSTTLAGGAYGGGSIFKLVPPVRSGGAWASSNVVNFVPTSGSGEPQPRDPLNPVFDPMSFLFGVSSNGGPAKCPSDLARCGSIWQLMPPTAALPYWSKKTIYAFQGTGDGMYPAGDFVFDATNDAFGTAGGGLECYHQEGIFVTDCGEIIALEPPAANSTTWTEGVIYEFNPHAENNVLAGPDGALPNPGLLLDKAGNLYGTTSQGGSGAGIVFKLNPPSPGGTNWVETILYTFTMADGSPFASVASDGAGNLYGTTRSGGQHLDGIVYKLAPPAAGSGAWTKTTLHEFTGGADGMFPIASLIVDDAGDLFGTTSRGGIANKGTVFEYSP